MPSPDDNNIVLFRKTHTSILGSHPHLLYILRISNDMRPHRLLAIAALLCATFSLQAQSAITSDDGLTPPNDTLVDALHKAGDEEVKTVHIATDHSYSDHRIALEKAVLDGLDYLKQK
jgi:hypothetical protein